MRYGVEERPDRWRLEEEDVPETPLHDAIIRTLVLLLRYWAQSNELSALIASNLGCRWDPDDARVGTDPDVVVIAPPPPEGERLRTLRVWEPGHEPPKIAVEVVSANTADKDYTDAPARCARLGVQELWIFDPLLEGPSSTGGPFTLQVWRLDAESKEMQRTHAGSSPAYSEELDAWLVTSTDGSRLRIASDRNGTRLWPTLAEAQAQRADEQAQRADEQAQRAEAAEAEVARLKALLAEKG